MGNSRYCCRKGFVHPSEDFYKRRIFRRMFSQKSRRNAAVSQDLGVICGRKQSSANCIDLRHHRVDSFAQELRALTEQASQHFDLKVKNVARSDAVTLCPPTISPTCLKNCSGRTSSEQAIFAGRKSKLYITKADSSEAKYSVVEY